jgi:hypothetical protein
MLSTVICIFYDKNDTKRYKQRKKRRHSHRKQSLLVYARFQVTAIPFLERKNGAKHSKM